MVGDRAIFVPHLPEEHALSRGIAGSLEAIARGPGQGSPAHPLQGAHERNIQAAME